MKLDIRYNNHPEDVKSYDTKKLRERFLIEKSLRRMRFYLHTLIMIVSLQVAVCQLMKS